MAMCAAVLRFETWLAGAPYSSKAWRTICHPNGPTAPDLITTITMTGTTWSAACFSEFFSPTF
jgi:hypothetical protein